jgi:GNAT superfamily N-acetyltransferase
VTVRAARRDDLTAIVALVADEDRTEPGSEAADDRYHAAFEAVDEDPRNEMFVADDGGEVIGYLQVTYIPGLGGRGRERAQLEAIRVRADRRGAGVGRALVTHAIERARGRGCTLVQLMSNKRRVDARGFYRSLGFVESHNGFKLAVD